MPMDTTKKANKENNSMGVYNDLALSCQEDVSLGIADKSVSEDFPDAVETRVSSDIRLLGLRDSVYDWAHYT